MGTLRTAERIEVVTDGLCAGTADAFVPMEPTGAGHRRVSGRRKRNVGGRSGVAWWKEVFGFLYATLPDWQWSLDDLVAEGDRAVARLTVRGTHVGSEIPFLKGIPPTGKSIVWTHHHTFRLVDGKIAEHWANRDDLGFLRQVTGQ